MGGQNFPENVGLLEERGVTFDKGWGSARIHTMKQDSNFSVKLVVYVTASAGPKSQNGKIRIF